MKNYIINKIILVLLIVSHLSFPLNAQSESNELSRVGIGFSTQFEDKFNVRTSINVTFDISKRWRSKASLFLVASEFSKRNYFLTENRFGLDYKFYNKESFHLTIGAEYGLIFTKNYLEEDWLSFTNIFLPIGMGVQLDENITFEIALYISQIQELSRKGISRYRGSQATLHYRFIKKSN